MLTLTEKGAERYYKIVEIICIYQKSLGILHRSKKKRIRKKHFNRILNISNETMTPEVTRGIMLKTLENKIKKECKKQK